MSDLCWKQKPRLVPLDTLNILEQIRSPELWHRELRSVCMSACVGGGATLSSSWYFKIVFGIRSVSRSNLCSFVFMLSVSHKISKFVRTIIPYNNIQFVQRTRLPYIWITQEAHVKVEREVPWGSEFMFVNITTLPPRMLRNVVCLYSNSFVDK